MALFILMGSTGIMAQGDPFGDYHPNDYGNNMSLVGYVYLNGEKLGAEAVVAAYCGNTLRGKQSPNDEGELYLSIGGDYNNNDQIYFKVYTDGKVIEVDQGLTYSNNANIGFDSPYIINLPSPIVIQTSSEGWATTCLPFNAAVPEGITVWNATAIENHELVISEVTENTILPANTPVLIRRESNLSDDASAPIEWLSKVFDAETLTQQSAIYEAQPSILKGTTEPTTVATNCVLTLGYSNEGNHELGFWLFTGSSLRANCAYIADFPAGSHGVTFRFDDTAGIGASLTHTEQQIVNNDVYDLQGRQIEPSVINAHSSIWKKGRHGQIIIIK